MNFSENKFDVVISSLVFHYIKDFDEVCKKVNSCISDGGDFVLGNR